MEKKLDKNTLDKVRTFDGFPIGKDEDIISQIHGLEILSKNMENHMILKTMIIIENHLLMMFLRGKMIQYTMLNLITQKFHQKL